MSRANPPRLYRSWFALVAVTMVSFLAAEYLDQRRIAVAAILMIAAIKVALIMRNFMEIAAAPRGIRLYLGAWTIACALLIFGMWSFAT